MDDIYSQILNLAVIFNPWLFLAVFLILLIAEFGVPIPYLMETILLLYGYNLVTGNIDIERLLLFCAVSIIGRLAGAIILFYVFRFGINHVFLKHVKPVLMSMVNKYPALQKISFWVTSRNSKSPVRMGNGARPLYMFGRKFSLSPLTVAIGRFLYLRFPITIALSARKQRNILLLGVAIFSIVWDAAYIIFGVLGGKGGLAPLQMILYPLGAMALISALVYGFRRLYTYSHQARST